jgi:DNA-binding NtrC family response regulator
MLGRNMPKSSGARAVDKALAGIRHVLEEFSSAVREEMFEEIVSGLSRELQHAATQGAATGQKVVGKSYPGKPPPTPQRRTKAEIEELETNVVQLLRKKPKLRAAQMAEILCVERRTLMRPLDKLVSAKRVRASGNTSAMVYELR